MSLNLAFPPRVPAPLQGQQDAILLHLQAQQTVNQLHDNLRQMDQRLSVSRALAQQLDAALKLSSPSPASAL